MKYGNTLEKNGKLKTLKDLNLFFSSRKKLEEEFYEYSKQDRKDNTVIRDCPMNVIGWFCEKRNNQIRQEAIKWIKSIQSGSGVDRSKFSEDMKGSIVKDKWNNSIFTLGIEYGFIIGFMKFFNITGNDLKENENRI